jgi:medium-chain acyl-[acyl-carrier-protein] hydrolase
MAGEEGGKSRWTVCWHPQPDAKVRLFCFPYAGGGASLFSRWSEHLPNGIELHAVQLPGHETRIAEPAHRDLNPLLVQLKEVLTPYLDRPFALLGHSMGALVCYELARKMRKESEIQPAILFLSGVRALHIPNPDPHLYALDKSDFLKQLQFRYGMPARLLQDSDLMELFIPLLRANFQMCESYVYQPDLPLSCPISIFGGLDDPRISPEDLAVWKQHTTGQFRLRMLEGGHYFFEDAWTEVAAYVAQDLESSSQEACCG